MTATLRETDREQLENAVLRLEFPGFIARVAELIGAPVERAIQLLPAKAAASMGELTQRAVLGSLKAALLTMKPGERHAPLPASSDLWHKAAAALSGGVGGSLGIAALALELPVSTTIIMRSIADVARSEGADLSQLPVQLECAQVLAFGGPVPRGDASEAGYFATRASMARMVVEASAHMAEFGLEREGAPVLVRLILAIAERYSLPVSAKAAAQLMPAIGAAGGALVNTLFIHHFQDVARGHFTVRRLERTYSPELIREQYADILQRLRAERIKD